MRAESLSDTALAVTSQTTAVTDVTSYTTSERAGYPPTSTIATTLGLTVSTATSFANTVGYTVSGSVPSSTPGGSPTTVSNTVAGVIQGGGSATIGIFDTLVISSLGERSPRISRLWTCARVKK